MELPFEDKCPICGNKARFGNLGDGQQADCPRCGRYRLTRSADATLRKRADSSRAKTNASSWIFEANSPVIDSGFIEQLFSLPSPTVGSKALKLLARFGSLYPIPGAVIRFAPDDSLNLQAASWSANRDELLYLFQDYLEATERAVSQSTGEGGGGYIAFRITPAGWELLEESRRALGRSSDGFIAMSFAAELRQTRDALLAGIQAAGWNPVIINREEFTCFVSA